MNTLLYLSYGQGPHELEVIYSVWSARHCSADGDNLRIVIYTDHPDSFSNVEADVELISTDQWSEWGGPQNFNHRRKILALQHAIQKTDAPVILVDGDTWWRGSVQQLFERVAPGRAVMHIREGSIAEIDGPRISELRSLIGDNQFDLADGSSAKIPADCQMWNAGVIGLHPNDSGILNDVIHLTDQFCSRCELHILEQFAFSFLLQTKMQLTEAFDLVFHYWPPYLHTPFRDVLPQLLDQAKQVEAESRAAYLYKYRPRPSLSRRGKVILKRIGQWCGLLRGRSRSNEW